MDPMLESFISESRDNLETAGRCFLALEQQPGDEELLNDLFRAMHTIKGSSGLFDIPDFTKVVHAAEDVLDIVRSGELEITSVHIDLFLDAMDQVSGWLDELESNGVLQEGATAISQGFVKKLRGLLDFDGSGEESCEAEPATATDEALSEVIIAEPPSWLPGMPDATRLELHGRVTETPTDILAVEYAPDPQCFFSGDDPLHTVRTLPGLIWFEVSAREAWPEPVGLDPYQCNLVFRAVAAGTAEEVHYHLRYVSEQVEIIPLEPGHLVCPSGKQGDNEPFLPFVEESSELISGGEWDELERRVGSLLEISGAELLQTSVLRWMQAILRQEVPDQGMLGALHRTLRDGVFEWPTGEGATTTSSSPGGEGEETAKANAGRWAGDQQREAVVQALRVQRQILSMPCAPELLNGRIASVAMVVGNLVSATGQPLDAIEAARVAAEEQQSTVPLLSLVDTLLEGSDQPAAAPERDAEKVSSPEPKADADRSGKPSSSSLPEKGAMTTVSGAQSSANHTLKVDQQRIDTLMDLVGELVVAKNALPFLARRAENEYGVRALAKEIKSQYAVINRLSEELQSAMMQIRMVPISTVFQRFPRLVRDLSRKLDKKIRLVLEGEETEADKNVVESLADPLIHLVRNSLDHGLEAAQEREAAGKPAEGTVILRAIPHDDQVVIEVTDDGRGIDPEVIKRKAYEKGVIDEQRLDTISDHEALQLIFAAGFSTAESVSDLSGRGVGMDVVRSTVQQAGGSVVVESEKGKGATVRLSLPLSMAVTRVMMVEVAGQCYGVAMDYIVETVRLPASEIRRIKHSEAIVLRDRLIPLFSLRRLLQIDAEPRTEEEEVAVLVMMLGSQEVGIVIDEFHEGLDIIQKPLEGVMANYPYYAGAALLGDGRVLLVLNIRELLACQ